MNVDNNLTFAGIASGTVVNSLPAASSDEQLLVLVHGGSGVEPAVEYKLADNTIVSFTSEGGSQSTAAEHYIDVDSAGDNIVQFVRQSLASNNNATVQVGAFGVMSYLSDEDAGLAKYQFDATNDEANTGRLIWDILDQGHVDIRAIENGQSSENFAAITISDLNKDTLRGAETNVEFLSPNSWAGTLITNNNTAMPELRSNPFCENRSGSPISLIQPGFIVDNTSSIIINDNAYVDYVGLAGNITLSPSIPNNILDVGPGPASSTPNVIKDRNPSALFIDGSFNPFNTTRAAFDFNGNSKMYFRSGVDADDAVPGSLSNGFLVPANNQLVGAEGYGSIVFDAEGPLDVNGTVGNSNAINILSLEEDNIGGTVFVEDNPNGSQNPSGMDPVFKTRTFATDADGNFLQYGKAAFMNNSRVFFNDAALQHTDAIHRVFSANTSEQSEATYIGGERLCDRDPALSATERNLRARQWRPSFVFRNGQLMLHDSAAFTGVDLVVPEGDVPVDTIQNNSSSFIFYSNGYAVDQGTGRNLILGTNVGALASDLNTIIDRDAHLDVQQESSGAGLGSPSVHALNLRDGQNDEQINADLVGFETFSATLNRLSQYSVHSLYLAHGSNISVGADGAQGENPETGATFTLATSPTLSVNGSFFSFESQGGLRNKPELSILTGQGGIFVGNDGTFELFNDRRALFNVMIGRSFNGAVDLKRTLASFGDGFGVSEIALDLSGGPVTVSGPGSNTSDFILDWKFANKDYSAFAPYIPQGAPVAGGTPAAAAANLTNLPTVEGRVGQLRVQNSRLGDPAHVMVDGGQVRELTFMARQDGAMPQLSVLARDNQPDPAIAPIGIVAMRNNGSVGIGPIPTSNESTEAAVTLGTNGVTLLPDGDASVTLNSDVIIDNTAHIVPGPNFGNGSVLPGNRNTLTITSQTDRELRIKSTGVLDLSLFDNANKRLAIGGKINVVAEPGARILLGGGELEITDDARIFAEKDATPFGSTANPSNTNDRRVKISGSGTWIFSEASSMQIPRDAIVGIEGLSTQSIADTVGQDPSSLQTVVGTATDLLWIFQDDARLQIGSEAEFGGALQVGNAQDAQFGDPSSAATVDFNIQLNGRGATMEIAGQGFFGVGAGIVSKPAGAPDNWTIGSLFNLNSATIDLREGKLIHNRIFNGSENRASLMAFSRTIRPGTTTQNSISFVMDNQLSRVIGGGNMYRIDETSDEVSPIVGTTNDSQRGILASKGVLFDPSKLIASRNGGIVITQANARTVLGNDPQNPGGTPGPDTIVNAFDYLKMNNVAQQSGPLATIHERRLGQPVIGYVENGVINRNINVPFTGLNGTSPSINPAFEQGIVGLALGPAGSPTAYNVVTA